MFPVVVVIRSTNDTVSFTIKDALQTSLVIGNRERLIPGDAWVVMSTRRGDDVRQLACLMAAVRTQKEERIANMVDLRICSPRLSCCLLLIGEPVAWLTAGLCCKPEHWARTSIRLVLRGNGSFRQRLGNNS